MKMLSHCLSPHYIFMLCCGIAKHCKIVIILCSKQVSKQTVNIPGGRYNCQPEGTLRSDFLLDSQSLFSIKQSNLLFIPAGVTVMFPDLESTLEFLYLNNYLCCEVNHTFDQLILETNTGVIITAVMYDYGEQCFRA